MAYICSVCGKSFTSGIRDSKGQIYCSEQCYEKALPKCSVCGKPMRERIIGDNGKQYCSNRCYETSWPRCAVCNRPMEQWKETKDGKKYCSEQCRERDLPKCSVCGKPLKEVITDEKGNHYCSENCFKTTWPKCSICGRPMNRWKETKEGKKYCSEQCYEKSLPTCSVCGKHVRKWYVDEHGTIFCSDHCYETTLPKCDHCGKPLRTWIETNDGRRFCNEHCLNDFENKRPKIEMQSALTAAELAYITGLSKEDCQRLMDVNHIDGDEALEAIDIFMQALNDHVDAPVEIVACMNNAGIYTKMASRLGAYNTMRGGVKGYGGFVFEELHAADAASRGANIQVLGNNGIADFVVKDPTGKTVYVQAKAGYKPGQIDWSKYKGQEIIVDKGNTALANEARAAGLTVKESNVFKSRADAVARAQQWESKITGKSTAPITATVTGAHNAGLASAKLAARVGVSMKLGENIYDVLAGDKDFSEAAADVLVDGVMLVGGAYFGTVALSIAGTAATALAGTAVGSAVVGAATGVFTAVCSTTVGGVVVGAVGTFVGGLASAPLLPVVAVGVTVGFAAKWAKSKF